MPYYLVANIKTPALKGESRWKSCSEDCGASVSWSGCKTINLVPYINRYKGDEGDASREQKKSGHE